MAPPLPVRLALSSYRALTRLLPRRDRAHREETLRLARKLLTTAWEQGGLAELSRRAVACHIDVFRRRLASGAAIAIPTARTPPVDTFLQDLRYTFRGAWSRPAFTAVTVATLALGIGANAAIFSVADVALRRPLPFRDGDRLVRVYLTRNGQHPWLSPRTEVLLAVQKRGRFFDSIVGQRHTSVTLNTPEGPERIASLGVTDGWLETLGVEPTAGRGFTLGESRQGREAGVMVVSYRFWQERFAGSRDLVGSILSVDEAPFTVVGIMPPGFRYPYENEIYFPLAPRSAPTGRWAYNIQTRLRPGVTVEQARAELAAISAELRGRIDGFGPEMALTAIPTRQVLLGDGEPLIAGLMAAVGFVLLIACANVASLLLARSLSRRQEMAIRAALGAGRARQLRQVLTESLVLALVAGGLGLLIAVWTRDALQSLIPGRLVNLIEGIPLDHRALGFCLLVSLATGLTFGLPLALKVSAATPAGLLRTGTRGSGSRGEHRALDAFLIGEIALVLVLLTGAALMISNLQALAGTNLGYDPHGVVTFRVSLEGARYADPAVRRVFARQAVDRLRAVPRVIAAGATTMYPWANGNFLGALVVESAGLGGEEVVSVNERHVTPGFLETLGVRLLAGRLIAAQDDEHAAPVAVISHSTAERLWPGQDPLGRTLRERGSEHREITVIGVVEDVLEFYGIDETWYLSYAQSANEGGASALVFTVRAARQTPGMTAAMREAIWHIDPTRPLFSIQTARDLYGETLRDERLGTWLLGGFAIFGLLLAAVGLYAITAFAVGRRTREIGVRMALGARPAAVMRSVIRGALGRGAIGVSIGLAGALALARLMRSVVTEIDPLHPGVLGATSALLLAVCALASWIPARRATRVDPAQTLRAD